MTDATTAATATKQDIIELKQYIVERENAWIKWVIGIQISYFTITLGVTLGAMYFMLQHIAVVAGHG